jgi:3-hydroxyacyl-CoA dehydrogenase / 3-hydroxy-2-methylbutyryl-CoA dehydrogenase
MKVEDCVAVVTGGASGLGEACVRLLTSGGGKAAIFDVQKEKGEALARELGGKAVFCFADVTSDESIKAAVAKAAEAFGGVNVAVNCAGVGWAEKIHGKAGLMNLDTFRKVVEINLVGTINVIRHAVMQMLSQSPAANGERGVIVNTASAAAFDGQIGQPAYSASKAGVVGMTLPVARECAAYGIRVCTICPGIFDTPMLAAAPDNVREALGKMVPFPQRLGRPAEFAALVQHIVQNEYLNGEVIRLDGSIRMAAK